MATSQKMTDKFLTCIVCMELFTDPCTLQCQHTFCRKCVTGFTKSQPEAIKAKSFSCPCCRRLTKVPDPDRPVEDWAEQVKPSFLIQGLMDSFGPGAKDTIYCGYCKLEGERTLATVWCSMCDDSLCDQCLRVHKHSPFTRQHDVCVLSDEVKVKRKRIVHCREHETESVRFLCKDCKKAVCQTCCIIYHRKCDTVVTIESELSSMKSTLVKSKEVLLKHQDFCKTVTDKKRQNVEEMTKMSSQVEKEIKTQSQRARDAISLKEERLLEELKNSSEAKTGQLMADIKEGEMAIQMYQQQSELIDQVVKSDCEMDVYEMYQSCENEEIVAPTFGRKCGTVNMRLRTDTDKLMNTINELSLGEIDVSNEVDLKASPVLKDNMNVTIAGDRGSPSLIDVTVLDVDGIDTVVVTDWSNKSVKSFYSRNNQSCHSKLNLDSGPWSLTHLKHNQVAVTVPDTKQIVTIEVKPDLKQLSVIQSEKKYYGITFLQPSTTAVGAKHPPSVDILNLSGTVIKTLTPQSDLKGVLSDPHFLCTTIKGDILVSNVGPVAILCLSPEGDILFTYSDNNIDPRGITVTNTGDILVASYSNENVFHLNEYGQFVQSIFIKEDGLLYMCGLCFDKRGRLYVCNHWQGIIKIFQFSV